MNACADRSQVDRFEQAGTGASSIPWLFSESWSDATDINWSQQFYDAERWAPHLAPRYCEEIPPELLAERGKLSTLNSPTPAGFHDSPTIWIEVVDTYGVSGQKCQLVVSGASEVYLLFASDQLFRTRTEQVEWLGKQLGLQWVGCREETVHTPCKTQTLHHEPWCKNWLNVP